MTIPVHYHPKYSLSYFRLIPINPENPYNIRLSTDFTLRKRENKNERF